VWIVYIVSCYIIYNVHVDVYWFWLHVYICASLWEEWRYQRGNQNPERIQHNGQNEYMMIWSILFYVNRIDHSLQSSLVPCLCSCELTNSSEHKTNVAKDYTERERECLSNSSYKAYRCTYIHIMAILIGMCWWIFSQRELIFLFTDVHL
jgi:hypothetical protein